MSIKISQTVVTKWSTPLAAVSRSLGGCCVLHSGGQGICEFFILYDPLKSETGRIRFRRVQFQKPSSVSSFQPVISMPKANSPSFSQNSPSLLQNSVSSLFQNSIRRPQSTYKKVVQGKRPLHSLRFNGVVCSNTLFSNTSALTNSTCKGLEHLVWSNTSGFQVWGPLARTNF